jgi:hypothetical protein
MSEPEQQVGGDQAPEQAEAKPKQRGRFQPGTSGNPSGRRRGAASRRTIAAMVAAHGSPLEFLLRVMSDEKAKMSDRLDAAKAALGFVHRRLPEHTEASCPQLVDEPSPKEVWTCPADMPLLGSDGVLRRGLP